MVILDVLAIFVVVMAATLFIFGAGYKLGMHQAKDMFIEELKRYKQLLENQNVK